MLNNIGIKMTKLKYNELAKPRNKNDISAYKSSESFNIKFDILRYAALQHPNSFNRDEVFETIPFDINCRTQQRLLESLSADGYLHKTSNKYIAEFKINTRAFIPFLSLLHPIK